jgi:hypothetical protein
MAYVPVLVASETILSSNILCSKSLYLNVLIKQKELRVSEKISINREQFSFDLHNKALCTMQSKLMNITLGRTETINSHIIMSKIIETKREFFKINL